MTHYEVKLTLALHAQSAAEAEALAAQSLGHILDSKQQFDSGNVGIAKAVPNDPGSCGSCMLDAAAGQD